MTRTVRRKDVDVIHYCIQYSSCTQRCGGFNRAATLIHDLPVSAISSCPMIIHSWCHFSQIVTPLSLLHKAMALMGLKLHFPFESRRHPLVLLIDWYSLEFDDFLRENGYYGGIQVWLSPVKWGWYPVGHSADLVHREESARHCVHGVRMIRQFDEGSFSSCMRPRSSWHPSRCAPYPSNRPRGRAMKSIWVVVCRVAVWFWHWLESKAPFGHNSPGIVALTCSA